MNKALISTKELQEYLSCGRILAQRIGEQAEAKVVLGRRIFWNFEKIKSYLEVAGVGADPEEVGEAGADPEEVGEAGK